MEPMWFYDEELPEWYEFREQAQQLEQEYLALRTALRDAESSLRSSPGDEHITARIDELKTKLAEVEKQAPWISADAPVEVLLWGVPHG